MVAKWPEMLAPGHLNIRIGRFRPISRTAFTGPARLPPCFNVLLSELSIEIWTVSTNGHSLSGRKRELHLEAVDGGGFAATRLRAMELIAILSRCYRFRGFVTSTPTSAPTKRASKRPYDDRARVRPQFARVAIWRRPVTTNSPNGALTSSPLWGFLVFLLYTMRRVDCRRCGGGIKPRGQNHNEKIVRLSHLTGSSNLHFHRRH